MPYVREAFQTLGETVVIDGPRISPVDVADADVLAIRSTTRVDRRLLEGSRLRFVGTATIGFDHLDRDYLEGRGIKWCYSAGCNANSVSEYVTAALLHLATRYGFCLEDRTIGVVGVGNVGRLVAEKAEVLGMRVLRNDPPRERTEGGSGFVSVKQVLGEADVITMHVPLTADGQDATFHMVDEDFLSNARPGLIFINSARGSVVDTPALIGALDSGAVGRAVVDTWEGEPDYSSELLERADIGTPHIAGHSFEGKVAGTVNVYREACRCLGATPTWKVDELLPAPEVPEVVVEPGEGPDEEALWDIVSQVYDICRDDADLRRANVRSTAERAAHFSRLRKEYPVRREFRFTRVVAANASSAFLDKIAGLGFAT